MAGLVFELQLQTLQKSITMKDAKKILKALFEKSNGLKPVHLKVVPEQ